MMADVMAPSPIIEVRHVCTRFGKAVVHEDVSLTIEQGEVFAIAGGNGSGKSTLMREIIGLQVPASGTIRLMGMESTGLGQMGAQDVYRRFGVMFQQGALFSSLTLEDNVAVPLKEHTDLDSSIDSGDCGIENRIRRSSDGERHEISQRTEWGDAPAGRAGQGHCPGS